MENNEQLTMAMQSMAVKTSLGDSYNIVSDNETIIDWFNRPQDTQVDIIVRQINEGLYDRFMTKPRMKIIDAGANIGLFGIYAHDQCERLVMVEPAPHCLYILQELLNGIPSVSIEPSAMSSENGTIKLNISSYATCNSIAYSTNTDVSVSVSTKTIETIMADHNLDHVDFIKCDIEGGEMLAIMDKTIEPVAGKIDSWLIEVHNTSTAAWPGNLGNNRDILAGIMRNHGYQTEYIIHDQLYAYK